MMDQSLLSELCSICHNETPKYKCPRCSARTCSLECSKKHKQRAQCSGIRDPTAYVKKSKLVTPAGIDHDYNFLTGVHRALDRAAEDVEGRDITGENEKRRRYGDHRDFRARVAETRVIIDRAPEGMSRQRMNMSRWNPKRKCIIWTVEWIHEDGSRDMTMGHDGVLDTTPLSDAYQALLQSKRRKRKRGSDADNREGRTTSATDGGVQSALQKHSESVVSGSKEAAALAVANLGATSNPLLRRSDENEHSTAFSSEQAAPLSDQATPESLEDASSDVDIKLEPDNAAEYKPFSEQQSSVSIKAESPEAPRHHFYLVKPHTSSSRPVLIPVPGSQSLFECLRDQVVLEFPTIQVLSEPPSSLPDRLMLESEYLNQARAEEQELDEMLAHVKQPLEEDRRRVKEEAGDGVPQDMKMIAEMLQKDVGGRR